MESIRKEAGKKIEIHGGTGLQDRFKQTHHGDVEVETDIGSAPCRIGYSASRTVSMGGYKFARMTIGFRGIGTLDSDGRISVMESMAHTCARILDQEERSLTGGGSLEVEIPHFPLRRGYVELSYGMTVPDKGASRGTRKFDVTLDLPLEKGETFKVALTRAREEVEQLVAARLRDLT